MPQFGSNLSIGAQNRSAVTDSNGNLIVSPDDGFGGSPLGVAARTQALYGIPNANFDILPPDPYTAITVANPLPYWDVAVNGLGTATMSYDDTTQSWAVRLDPTAGTASGESITLKARTYLLNDSNLTLRQKAFLSLTKVGTQATNEWSVVLSATYYSEAGTQLSTYNIGTATSGSSFTTINGFTTSGTAAIDPAAQYADLAITLTTSGSVAGTAVVDLNSLILQTSTGAAGAQSFLLTQSFTASGNFVVPTGVDYVGVVAMAGGNGGSGGGVTTVRGTATSPRNLNEGGDGPFWMQREQVYVAGAGTISVGIGAGGIGGTGQVFTKAAGATTVTNGLGGTGGGGGYTTFGTYVTFANASTDVSIPYGLAQTANNQGGLGAGGATAGTGLIHPIALYTSAPFTTFGAGGSAGGDATGTGGASPSNGTGGAANVGTAIGGSGGGGGGGTARGTPSASNGGVGGPGGGGSGGGGAARFINGTVTITATGGNGADGTYLSAAGGGGGAIAISASSTANYDASTITATGGDGGDGSAGWLVVYYIG